MRYRTTSWTDVDRTLEAFRYSRLTLLVLTSLALPFAAWEVVTDPGTVVPADSATLEIRGSSVPATHAKPILVCDEAQTEGRILDARV